jgi:hypothetical protein
MPSMIHSFFNPDEAYEAGQAKENQGWRESKGYLDPYHQQGQAQYGRLNTAAGRLMDPRSLQDEWINSYKTSPYAQQRLAQNQTLGLEGASSMGLMGSSAALGNIQQGGAKIMNEDRQAYMNDMMEKYMKGIGLSQDMYNTGYGAAGQLSSGAQKHGENQAALEVNRQLAPGERFGQIAGGIAGGFANAYAPGAGMFSNAGNASSIPAYAA